MRKTYYNIFIYRFAAVSFLCCVACSLPNIKAGSETANKNLNSTTVESNGNGKAEAGKAVANSAPQITAQSVAGTYKYSTYKNHEGYSNTLEIKAAGADKLSVSLEGVYNYMANGEETMHDASGEGDAQLRNNIAIANIKDETDKNCRVTITFNANQARVAIPDTCHFNITLDGVYKKDSSKTAEKPANKEVSLREVAYDKLSDFVNDFDHHQAGEHFTITDVPADKIKKHESATGFPDLYYLQSSDDDSDVATGFVTAYMLIKSLAANKTSEPAKLRATAVLIEVKGEFDVYRTSFITKIEGLNDDGSVMWTANGAEPPKVKFKN